MDWKVIKTATQYKKAVPVEKSTLPLVLQKFLDSK